MRARVIGPSANGCLRVTVQGPDDRSTEVDVPVERILSGLRMPNCEFVAVMRYGEFKRVESNGEAWLEVQRQIRAVAHITC